MRSMTLNWVVQNVVFTHALQNTKFCTTVRKCGVNRGLHFAIAGDLPNANLRWTSASSRTAIAWHRQRLQRGSTF